MPYALQLVRTRVEQIQGELPAGVSVEVERMTPSLFPILSYNLEGGDAATLYDIARYQITPGALAHPRRRASRRAGDRRARDRGDRRSGAPRRGRTDVRRRCERDSTGHRRGRRRARGARLPAVPRRLVAGGALGRGHRARGGEGRAARARPRHGDAGHRGSRAHHVGRRPAGGADQRHAPDRRQHRGQSPTAWPARRRRTRQIAAAGRAPSSRSTTRPCSCATPCRACATRCSSVPCWRC